MTEDIIAIIMVISQKDEPGYRVETYDSEADLKVFVERYARLKGTHVDVFYVQKHHNAIEKTFKWAVWQVGDCKRSRYSGVNT